MLTDSLIEICKTAKSFDYLQVEAVDDAAPLVIRMSNEPALVAEARTRHKAGGHLTVSIITGVLKRLKV